MHAKKQKRIEKFREEYSAVGCALGGIFLILLDSYTLKQHLFKYKNATPPPKVVRGAEN
jgi:hypothetical protein